MECITMHAGVVMPVDRADVDTDAIIPKQFMKSLRRTGFGDNLFDEWRYLDHGEPGQDCTLRPRNQQCVFNLPQYAGASILLARSNFGCGSSREHATWALFDHGFRVLIASSFADIFRGNCINAGILPVVLDEGLVDELFRLERAHTPLQLRVDLHQQVIALPDSSNYRFEIDALSRRRLLEGLDAIALTLENAAAISAYEAQRCQQEPWLFDK